jgi:hypothetical protein
MVTKGFKSFATISFVATYVDAPSLNAPSLASFCSVETRSPSFTLAHVTMLFLSSL